MRLVLPLLLVLTALGSVASADVDAKSWKKAKGWILPDKSR